MANYKTLSKEIENLIKKDIKDGTSPKFYCDDLKVLRRKDNAHDNPSIWRTAFIRDIDKIINCPFYNRYADKTQVFSLYKTTILQEERCTFSWFQERQELSAKH